MVFLWWCFSGGVFVVTGGVVVFLFWCGGVLVVVFVWWCFCFGVVVFLCLCFCGVFVFLWWCFCMFILSRVDFRRITEKLCKEC